MFLVFFPPINIRKINTGRNIPKWLCNTLVIFSKRQLCYVDQECYGQSWEPFPWFLLTLAGRTYIVFSIAFLPELGRWRIFPVFKQFKKKKSCKDKMIFKRFIWALGKQHSLSSVTMISKNHCVSADLNNVLSSALHCLHRFLFYGCHT